MTYSSALLYLRKVANRQVSISLPVEHTEGERKIKKREILKEIISFYVL